MFEKKILNIYAVIVGIFFLISGIGKVIDTAGFSNLISQYGLGYLNWLSPVIVIGEIILGLLLLLLINPKRDSFISLFLLVVFTAAFAYAHFARGINDCGCFGTINTSDLPPVLSFLRNFILIIMSLIVWLKYPEKQGKEVRGWKLTAIISVLGISSFFAGFTFSNPLMSFSRPQKSSFLNQNVKDTELSKYIKTSQDSTYLVFCFSYTCNHCWNSIENLRQYRISGTVDSVLAMATGRQDAKLFFYENFNLDFYIRELPGDTIKKLTDAFPTAFFIERDTVRVVIKSVLPSPVTYKKLYRRTKN